MSRELATVCLCTYNESRYLRPLLASLVEQTLLPAEMLVGDDGSSDDTLQIVRDFAADAPFPVQVLSNQRRLGPPAGNLELLLSKATGSVLFPCDEAVARFSREILTTQPSERFLQDFGGIRPSSADAPGSYRLCDGETVVSHLQEVVDRADEAPLA